MLTGIRNILILILTIFCFVLIAPHGIALAYVDHNSMQDICSAVADDKFSNPINIRIVETPQKVKVFIPPTALSFGIEFKNRQSSIVDVKAALRYKNPPKDYPSTLDDGYHDWRNDRLRSLDKYFDDVLVRMSGFNNTPVFMLSRSPLEYAGDYFFVNIFKDRHYIITLDMQIDLDIDATRQWCQQGAKPGDPSVSPPSGTWKTSPQQLKVTSAGAEKIYYKIESASSNTQAPADPANPDPPDEKNYDGVINGSSGSIALSADQGEYKKFRIALRAYNEQGWSNTKNFSYSIDRLFKKVGTINVNPGSSSTDGSSIRLNINADNATEIRFLKEVNSSADGVPKEPADPGVEVDSYSSVAANGQLELTTTSGTHKIVKIRFVGYNVNNPEDDPDFPKFGEVSEVYTYSLKGSLIEPGEITVVPGSGKSFTSRENLTVSSSDSDRIFYTYTLDGSAPDDPTIFPHGRVNGPVGTVETRGENGKIRTLKMRFAGYNSQTNAFGPVSEVYSYTMDLRNQGGNGGNPGPTPSPGDKIKCEEAGGVWIEILGFFGFCSFPIDSGQSPSLNKSYARSNPGNDVTAKTFNADLNSFDPAKPFFKSDNGNDLNLVDLVDMLLNPDQHNNASGSEPYFEVSSDQDRLVLDLIDEDSNLNLQLHLKILEILTTSDNENLIELNKYSDLVFTTHNLKITLRFAAHDWSSLSNALSWNAYNIKEAIIQSGQRRGVMSFSSYCSELGKEIQRVLRPSFVMVTGNACQVGDLARNGSAGFDICYDASGKWQRMIPFVYHYDEFYGDLSDIGLNVYLDPFSGQIWVNNSGQLIWTGIPDDIVEIDGVFSEDFIDYSKVDCVSGNGLPELILGKGRYSQMLYSLFPE